MEKFLNRVIAACAWYGSWYQRSPWGDFNVPSCPVCYNRRENLVLSSRTLVSYRYQESRLTMRVLCPSCGSRMLATSAYGSKSWTYFIN